MSLADMHPEDIKAGLRKRFRTVSRFEREKGLPAKSVTDILRGYKSARVEGAILDALAQPIASESELSEDSRDEASSHRQNAGSK